MTVREIILKAIRQGATNAETRAAVIHSHPHSKVSLPTINWHRVQLRKADPKIPSDLNARKKA